MLLGKVFKIKENKLATWKAWCIELQTTYAIEAKKTLIEEGIGFEGFLIFGIGDDFYTAGFSYSNNEPKTANLENKLNVLHRQMKQDCLEEPIGKIEGGYFLSA